MRGILAPYYRALHPMTPTEVRALRPSEVASILGLDRVPMVEVVALTDEQLAAADAAARARRAEFAEVAEGVVPRAAGGQRVRAIVVADG